MSIPNSAAKPMSAGHEPATKALVFSFFLWAGIWLLIGTTYGLLAAVKLFWPDTLAYSLLSFGRIRPIHTNIVLFGWSSFALTGLALFVVTRTEPRRDSRRLQTLRGWSHEQSNKIFARSSGTSGSNGV